MKRLLLNFNNNYDFLTFKNYAANRGISISAAILNLAKESLERLEDEILAEEALKAEKENIFIPENEMWENV